MDSFGCYQRPATPCDDCYMPQIPAGTRVTEFIGEGSANVVVRIELPPHAPPALRSQFSGKLLRLQKASNSNENRPFPYVTQYDHFCSKIQPLFSQPDKNVSLDDLVSHELVDLRACNVIEQVNGIIDRMDKLSDPSKAWHHAPPTPEMLSDSPGFYRECLPEEWQNTPGSHNLKKRKKQFIGSRLAFVDNGLLVEDMSVSSDETGILIEIKPKWLLQSASAPRTSIRCRNCAIELYRSRNGHSKQTRPMPCPMLLLSDNWRDRRDFMSQLLIAVEPDEWFVEPLLQWGGAVPGSKPNRLVQHLRDLQADLDKDGPLKVAQNPGNDRDDFPLAMTMRDCSVLIKVVRNPVTNECNVIAKVGDLDMKNSTAKMPYWQRTEKDLVTGSAYTDEVCHLQHRCGLATSS